MRSISKGSFKLRSIILTIVVSAMWTTGQAQTDTSSYFPRGLWGIWLDVDTQVSPYPPRALTPIQWNRERRNFDSIAANYLVAWIPYTSYDSLMSYGSSKGYKLDMNMDR